VRKIEDDRLCLDLGDAFPTKRGQPAPLPAGARPDELVVHHVRRRQHANAQLAQPTDVAQLAIQHMAALYAQENADRSTGHQTGRQIGSAADDAQLTARPYAPALDPPDEPLGNGHVAARGARQPEGAEMPLRERPAQVRETRRTGQPDDVHPGPAQP